MKPHPAIPDHKLEEVADESLILVCFLYEDVKSAVNVTFTWALDLTSS